jgi:DNA primase
MRQPADRIAWLLLLESRWWETLGSADHALLCALPGWHGELFRFLDRQAAEHGSLPWAALRERIATEPWADAALALVDAEDPAIEPLADDLPRSLDQLRTSGDRNDAMRVLGRI